MGLNENIQVKSIEPYAWQAVNAQLSVNSYYLLSSFSYVYILCGVLFFLLIFNLGLNVL